MLSGCHELCTPSTRVKGVCESLQRSLPSSIRAFPALVKRGDSTNLLKVVQDRLQRLHAEAARRQAHSTPTAAMRAVVLALAASTAAALTDSRKTPCPLYTPKITLNQPPRVATLAMG